jgi:hypothetical protein
MDLPGYAIPAVVSLVAKALLFFYARRSDVRNLETRLYLLFLFALALQNVAEISGFYSIANHGRFPEIDGLVYFAASIIAVAFLLHLAFVLSTREEARLQRGWRELAIYAPAAILELLLWFTPWLVQGFRPMAYTYERIPGPAYFLFEVYVVACLLAVIGVLIHGSLHLETPTRRLKPKIMLIGLLPFFVLVLLVIGLGHYGLRPFNATATLPIAVFFFLAITAYAIHQHRILDIAFYIPWSKVRQRKTAFYRRIRAMIAEIADLDSVGQAVNRLADALRCPIALVGGPEPALAFAGNAKRMIDVPIKELRRIEHIVVTNEIADTLPQTHALLKQHGVAAVVPFFPHSRTAASWMLLGDAFSEQVYTPLDFRMVEQLFDKMGELFLDKLLFLRSQLHDAREQLQTLQLRYDMSQQDAVEAHRQIAVLQRRIAEMERGRAARAPGQVLSLVDSTAEEKPLARQLRDLEARMIMRALQRSGGDIARAAELLELSVATLREGIERCGLAGEIKGASE